MISEVSKGQTVAETVAQAEDLVKFAFFAENKDLSRRELCGGLIAKTVSINGTKLVVLTTLTEADVSKYRESMVFDYI